MNAQPERLVAAEPITIAPVTGQTGAEIGGVSLSGELDEATICAIRAALMRYKVLFFRDQHDISNRDQEDFAARLGEPVAHPTAPLVPGSRYLLDLDTEGTNVASSWHTDVTFVPAYPDVSILRAIEVPAAGGDTLWANTAAAYERLPEPLKLLVERMTAIHSNVHDTSDLYADRAASAAYRTIFARVVYETEHPVVRIHPESGERTLVVGHFLTQFVGLSTVDSQRLRSILQEHITKPENTVRWRWRKDDVAIWDNRATQHRAVADFAGQRRHLRRVTISGSTPIGPDGFQSRLLGEPAGAPPTA
jgi:taurine dioxygenase